MSSAITGSLHPTIPVVDMNDFYAPSKKQNFIDAVSKASQEVGFFAVINSGIDHIVVDKAYTASQQFFEQPEEKKREIYNKECNGQRGWVPGETAQGHLIKDHKEFVHIGYKDNLWPDSMDLKTPFEALINTLDKVGEVVKKTFALAIDEKEDLFIEMTKGSDNLLRALYYPENPAPGAFWAGKHTDIDLFTILPPATEEGLQVLHNDKWISVTVPQNSVIINVGDMLENLTNGFFKSSVHQVVSKPNIKRFSIVYFVHPKDTDRLDPREKCIAKTGGVAHFPNATRMELLGVRLIELVLAGDFLENFVKESKIMDRIETLVKTGTAAPAVKRTWELSGHGSIH